MQQKLSWEKINMPKLRYVIYLWKFYKTCSVTNTNYTSVLLLSFLSWYNHCASSLFSDCCQLYSIENLHFHVKSISFNLILNIRQEDFSSQAAPLGHLDGLSSPRWCVTADYGLYKRTPLALSDEGYCTVLSYIVTDFVSGFQATLFWLVFVI